MRYSALAFLVLAACVEKIDVGEGGSPTSTGGLDDCRIACEKLITCWEGEVGDWGYGYGYYGDYDYGYYEYGSGYYGGDNRCYDSAYYYSGYYYGSGEPSMALCDDGWRCSQWSYNDGWCDCGCGIPDPDCYAGGCTDANCSVAACGDCHGPYGGYVSCGPYGVEWENGSPIRVNVCDPDGGSCPPYERHADSVELCMQGCTADPMTNGQQINCISVNACPGLLYQCIGLDGYYGY